jgi:hypothetical protein
MSSDDCEIEDCRCACHEDDDFDEETHAIPDDALLFTTTNSNVFARDTLVQLVGFGFAQKEDDPEQADGVMIWAQVVHLRDMDGGPNEDYWPESWGYFRDYDLEPLTPAARDVLELCAKQNCEIEEAKMAAEEAEAEAEAQAEEALRVKK